MTHWHDAGFGTDPEGDARRRAELEAARVDPADLAEAAASIAERVAPAHWEGVAYALSVISAEPADPEVAESLYPTGHEVTRTEYGSSVAIVCACGRWECIVTGPSSASWAGRDYRRHVDEETARDA